MTMIHEDRYQSTDIVMPGHRKEKGDIIVLPLRTLQRQGQNRPKYFRYNMSNMPKSLIVIAECRS